MPQQQQQQQHQSQHQSRSRQSFTLVPILKPASSMPGSNGHLLDGDGIDGVAVDNADATNSSQYHSSQPNLLSSNSNSYLYLPGNGTRAGAALNGGMSNGDRATGYRGAAATAAAAAGLGRRAVSIERRTTPYYYHELLQKNIFDSSLNLLQQEKEKNSNLKLEAAGLTGNSHAAVAKRGGAAPLAKPQQRLPSSSAKLAAAYGSFASTSNLLSNGNGNGNGNGNSSSAGTLVDDGGAEEALEVAELLRGSGQACTPAARSLNLAFNNLSNQIANLNNLSSNNNSSNLSNNNSHSNNNNNNADTNNNSECIA